MSSGGWREAPRQAASGARSGGRGGPRLGHESDAVQARGVDSAHHLDHPAIRHAGIGTQLHLGLRMRLRHAVQPLGQGSAIHAHAADEDLASGIDRDFDRIAGSALRGALRPRQVEADGTGQQRRGQDEDDHEHQHDIHQGRHVDVAHRLGGGCAFESAECHGSGRAGGGGSAAAGRGFVQKQFAQVEGEAFEIGFHTADPAPEQVVGQHGGNGHGQARRRHDQRLADRTGDAIDRYRSAPGQRRERMVDAPDRAEQADERRRGSHGGQQHLPELQASQDAVQCITQDARELLGALATRGQRAGLGVVGDAGGGVHQGPYQAVRIDGHQTLARRLQRGRTPELGGAPPHTGHGAPQQAGLPEDDHPARDGHGQQQQCRDAGDHVPLMPPVPRVHGYATRGADTGPVPGKKRSAVQAEHVEHVEQARAVRRQEAGRAQAALGIPGTAGGLVGDFDALARAREQHRMVAHDVAAAHRGEADGGRIALAGQAFAAVHGAVLELAAQRLGDDLAHLERRAGGGIHLVAVVRLDDLDVVARGQRPGRHLQELEGDVHAHAHVGRHDDGGAVREGFDLCLLGVGEAGGSDHGLDAMLRACRQMGQRAFRPGEIDQHVAAGQAVVQVGRDGHAAGMAQEGRGIGSQGRAARHVQSAREDQFVAAAAQRLDQHAAHAAGRARDSDADRRRSAGGRRGRSSGYGHCARGKDSKGRIPPAAQRVVDSSGG